ncbi:MAG TPA: hypothetical protein VEQ41_06705 [Solirubrobacterales bacterium]|nr:hypothetical protein [Solirubrobacterales bacterium]
MKIKLKRPSPAMLVALLALFFAVGGNVVAYGLGRNSVHSSDIAREAVRANDLAKIKLRSGRVIDFDSTAHDGSSASAFGTAKCRRGEQLVGGGTRQRSGSETLVVPHISLREEGPVLSERAWTARWNSNVGGAAREHFIVFAMCLVK